MAIGPGDFVHFYDLDGRRHDGRAVSEAESQGGRGQELIWVQTIEPDGSQLTQPIPARNVKLSDRT